MIRKTVITLMLCMVFTSGCAIRSAGVEVDMPGVEVGLQSGAIHCPPGQAKKGNC